MNAGTSRLTQRALAAALGLSPAAVTKLKRQGMPVDSIRHATEWRRHNVRLDVRARALPSDVPASVADVERLGTLGIDALTAGHFHLVEATIRAAMASLPPAEREAVRLPSAVWDRLTAHLPLVPEGGDLSEADCGAMGVVWWAVAVAGPARPLALAPDQVAVHTCAREDE